MAYLPDGRGRDIHGDGDSVHSDEHSSDDGRSSVARSMPSYADSMASGFDGDLETNVLGDTTLNPPDENDSAFEGYTDGDWYGATHDDFANDDSKGSKQGTFGVLCGNWGNKWSDKNLNDHMKFDLKSSPCTLIILQEAPRELLEHLRQPGVEGVIDERLDDTRGGGENWLVRPQHEFIGIRGPEEDPSVLIAARKSLVQAVCLRLFRFREDGTYKAKKKTGDGARKMARSRILIVSCRMRFFRFPLEEDTLEEELVVVSVHLHHMTAKKEVQNGAVSLVKFWDELAAYIVEFRGRILAGDFNMALWQVIPELRMRGLQVNVAAWYPFKAPYETTTRIDSTAIFIVGPVDGIRKIFDASALGISPAQPSATDFRGGGDMPEAWRLKEKVEKGPDGRERNRRPHSVPKSSVLGSGYHLTSYRPQNASRMQTMVRWNFEPAIDNESAVAEVVDARRRDKDLFPTMSFLRKMPGGQSEHWPSMPLVEQKLVGTQMFDPKNEFFRKGAHMPLMIFVGGNKDTRRSDAAVQKRNAKRQAIRDGKCKGKGKRGETDSSARGSGRWTGGESRASNSWTQGSWSSNSWTEGGYGWANWRPVGQQPGGRPENVAPERQSMWRQKF